ncbi:MAG: efflux RND transporter periplasmic adaptor subunit [Myxococcota bacterium]
MHPQIRKGGPSDCPICGMALVPAHAEMDEESTGLPTELRLSHEAMQLARIQTLHVSARPVPARRRLQGRLEGDESSLRTVTARIAGRVDRLFVATTGAEIVRGQRLALLYSPEVYAAAQDLQIAKTRLKAVEDEAPPTRAAAEAALSASRRRLTLLGLTETDIDRMTSGKSPTTEVAIRAPTSGTVLKRLVTEGQYVATGDPLFHVADLGKLWVQLEADEAELGRLDLGDEVEIQVPALHGTKLESRVSFVDPIVDPRTRVARVRIEVENQTGVLRPGMYVEALIKSSLGSDEQIVVPESAVLFTGRRSLVYVESDTNSGPSYLPREVELGPALEGAWVIRSGLVEGEHVVVEGAFVLDADLQIRGGPSAMTRESPKVELTPGPSP